MNRLTDEQMDEFIKAKFKKDNQISDKANSVFANFNPKQFSNEFTTNFVKQDEKINKVQQIKHETSKENKVNNIYNAGKKVIEMTFYQRLNRVLSVAAVSLTVVLVGGSALYFNMNGQNNQNNSNNQTIVYSQKYLVKNEPMKFSNESVLKESENGFIKAYLLGKKDVGIYLTSTYWNEFDEEFKSTDCYKVENIDKNISDILVGSTDGVGLPYVFLLMEDGTVEYVDLNCMNNYVFYFVARPVEGLTDVVGLERKTKKFSYSNTDYEYVNAIRSDGLRKEIEIGVINNWNDTVVENFDRLNEKYIKAHNGEGIPDDGKGDFEADGKHYWSADIDKRYVYYMKGQSLAQDLYRVERSTGKETRIATGITGMMRNNSDGRISFYVDDNNYAVYELDNNIIFRHSDNSVINAVTSNIAAPEKNTNENQSNEVTDTNKISNNYYSAFAELANTHYKIDNFKKTRGTTVYCYEIKFDENGKPTITVNSKDGNQANLILETKNITNIKQDYASGTSYITFDFTATTPDGEAIGSAEMKYSNVDNNEQIGIKINMTIDGITHWYNNADDYVYMDKI